MLCAMELAHSVGGVPIRLTAERWIHIVENHDELAGRMDDVLLIGIDCHGRYESNDYSRFAASGDDSTLAFRNAAHGGDTKQDGFDITDACMSCEYPVAENVDLRLCVFGEDPSHAIGLEAVTDKGRQTLESLGRTAGEIPAGREAAVKALVKNREEHRDGVFELVSEQIKEPTGILEIVGNCINCYNCRVACPVCYCRECVFVTETFRHASENYYRWAEKRGRLKMPTDTMFYHLTRMLHMSTLCVGCGQCTSACPSDIPVGALFRTVSWKTQQRFGYQPGRDVEEAQPLATFHTEELPEVTGQEN